MIKPLDVVTEIIGDDEQTRIRYAIDDFLKLEQDTPPRQLYDYWTRLPRNALGKVTKAALRERYRGSFSAKAPSP